MLSKVHGSKASFWSFSGKSTVEAMVTKWVEIEHIPRNLWGLWDMSSDHCPILGYVSVKKTIPDTLQVMHSLVEARNWGSGNEFLEVSRRDNPPLCARAH